MPAATGRELVNLGWLLLIVWLSWVVWRTIVARFVTGLSPMFRIVVAFFVVSTVIGVLRSLTGM